MCQLRVSFFVIKHSFPAFIPSGEKMVVLESYLLAIFNYIMILLVTEKEESEKKSFMPFQKLSRARPFKPFCTVT